MANLLLIESPGKVKKLGQILGSGWIIKASMGHVRELANDGVDALGFEMEAGRIDCHYQPRDTRSKKVLSELRQAVKSADRVYIATDPDREGETIGWHLQQALHLKNPQRVVYSEITPQAVRAAIAQPRSLDQNLIAAGRARDCLDKLVGYTGSRHVVWPLNNGAKSMGRVQSAALHLLCVREREIQAFVPQDYWSVWVRYGEGFKAFYRSRLQPQRQATQDIADDKKAEPESERVTSQARADALVAIAQAHPHTVVRVEGKQTTQSPPPPFVTSTLQQAAGSKLHFSPEQTMKIAQSLYEKGYITYMRTDSVNLSDSFCESVSQYLQQHDPTNLPQKTTQHRAVKGAQEAHEAIRPTEVSRLPQSLQAELSSEIAHLYELIWNRAVASQCAAARLRKTRIVTQSGEAHWEARGQVLEFAGYTRYWNNLSADSVLPAVTQGQVLQLEQAQAEQKQTQPPSRYSEPKLVKLMEQKGIGRPSTYAPTIKTLRQREYVQGVKGKLQPTALGLALDGALEKLLPDLIQPEFTAQMEAALDAIATGEQEWQAYLIGWNQSYFAPAIAKAKQQLSSMPLSGQPTAKATTTKAKGRKPSGSKKLTSRAIATKKVRSTRPKNQAQPKLNDSSCPICGAVLEHYSYTKDGQDKVMLRCSILENRRGKCKEVAFFQSRGEFWSPKFGTLKQPHPAE